MPTLDSYLVTLGVKGQDVVLSTMDKIRKKGDALSKKKAAVNLAAKPSLKPNTFNRNIRSSANGTIGTDAIQKFKDGEKQSVNDSKTRTTENKIITENKKITENESTNEKNNKDTVNKFKNSVQDFSSSAATLDPTATIKSFSSAVGTSLSGIEVLGESLGRLPEGIAQLANTTLTMAKNTVDMAKQSTMAYHQLTERNAAKEFYGSNVKKEYGVLSNTEMAGLVNSVSGSMGKIQKPLADEINNLMSKKDTGALGAAVSGNWESTGTDKGWILQQITNGMQGMPPSVKQAMNANLLKNNADIIQDYAPEQRGVQANAAAFADRNENQTANLYKATLGENGATKTGITSMDVGLNNMQVQLLDVGTTFADAITSATKAIGELPMSIKKLEQTFKEFSESSSLKNTMLSLFRAGN